MGNGIIPNIYEELEIEAKIIEKEIKEEIEEEEKERTEEEMRELAKEGYFVRDIKKDKVYCPEGEILRRKSTNRGRIRYYNSIECKKCKNRCTKVKTKTVDFSEEQKIMGIRNYGTNTRKKKKKLKEKKKIVVIKYNPNKEEYKMRKEIVEHPFGTLKRTYGITYTLLKGIEKVEGEIGLGFLAYNIRRYINILGTKEGLEKIRAYFKEKRKEVVVKGIEKSIEYA